VETAPVQAYHRGETMPTIQFILRGGVYVLIVIVLAYTWGLTGYSKLTAGGVPKGFADRFEPTFLATLPGIAASFYSIAVLEAVAAIVAVGSLLRGEFLPGRKPIILSIALLLSLVLFAQLGFGLRLIRDNDGAFNLFMYFAATLVLLLAVMKLDERPGTTTRPSESA
jgi:hypothetical protein